MKYMTRMYAMCALAADGGQKKQRANIALGSPLNFHLYYKPSTRECDGELRLIPDCSIAPDGYLLACDTLLDSGVPYDRYYSWIELIARRLPILAHF